MSFANPTPINLGMTGTFNGRPYRVAGRVVMGMDDGGGTYYWNEFNLVSNDGESATLVYEETERGGEWRLFTLFEVEYPLTAADAATKRVGDRLTLDDREVRVTLVDESRVYHIEGEAPEGVEVGDIAHYFNAEASQRMIVVSWTGDEVEYYRGVTISAGPIAEAFNLPRERLRNTARGFSTSSFSVGAESDTQYLSPGAFFKIVLVILVVAILLAAFVAWQPGRTRPAITKTSAPAAPLQFDRAGMLDGKTYRVRGHAIVEIAQVGRVYDRHEFQLLDDDGNQRLLIYGLKPGEKAWYVFTPLQPLEPMSPAKAAALRVGETVNLNGYIVTVSEVFQSVLRQTENAGLPDLPGGTVFFGFSTQAGAAPLLVRWNQLGIQFFRGRLLTAKDFAAAFPPPPVK